MIEKASSSRRETAVGMYEEEEGGREEDVIVVVGLMFEKQKERENERGEGKASLLKGPKTKKDLSHHGKKKNLWIEKSSA